MSHDTPYASDPNSPRWPLYAMSLFALIICIIFWRGCHFSGSDAPAPMPAAVEATN